MSTPLSRPLAALALAGTLALLPRSAGAEPRPGERPSMILRVNVAGAIVEVDGRRQPPASPAPLELDAGVHRLKVASPGFTRWEGELRLSQGERARVDVELRPGRVPLICFVSMAVISAAVLGAGGGVLATAGLGSADPSTARTAAGATLLGVGGLAAITTGVLGAFVRWRKASARFEVVQVGRGAALLAGGALP